MMPFFSIIIPTLNEEKYLPRLLKSLVGQTYKNFEVIIVDAHSIDKTVEKAYEFEQKLSTLKIVNSHIRNVYMQRNLGVKSSVGNYIVSFDADVLAPENFLYDIHHHIMSGKLDFITTWLEPDVKNPTYKMILLTSNLAMEMAKSIGKPFAGGFNTIIKRNIFHRLGGFREDLSISEDHEFSTRVKNAGYELTILNNPRLVYSMRRIRSQGFYEVFKYYARANLYFLLNGPITKKEFGYEMGGHVHKHIQKSSMKMLKISSYIKQLANLQNKIDRLISD